MDQPETEVVDCDVLIVGSGMSGCATSIWRPHAVGKGRFVGAVMQLAPSFYGNWLTLG